MIVCNGLTYPGFACCVFANTTDFSKLEHAATTAGKHPLKAGIWVHIAATFDGDKTPTFIDGEPAGTCDEFSGSMQTTTWFPIIGSDSTNVLLWRLSDIDFCGNSHSEIIAASEMNKES